VRSSRGVRVAVPWRIPFEKARQIALTKLAWIRRALTRVERARQPSRLDPVARTHGSRPGRLSVRRQGTLWGSASRTGRIQLNVLLAVVPPDLADYVILHELVHTRVRGHGRHFWGELERRMPDARRRQARLREYSLALF
jgi:predicted metal-dependent hydrolase